MMVLGSDWLKLPIKQSTIPTNFLKVGNNSLKFPQPALLSYNRCLFISSLWTEEKLNQTQPRKEITVEHSRVKMAGTLVRRMKLGSQGLYVSAQGLGCMGMSYSHGPPKPEEDMIKVIRYAISRGITFFDTSDGYGPHTNEILIGKALKGVPRENFQIATKFAFKILEGGGMEICGDPDYAREACLASLKRLDIDYIDLYYIHRIDTKIPIEITMGALKLLVEEGKIKHIGLSEASPDTIRRAHAVHPITAVQLEWSLWTRDSEEQVIPTCRELGIGIVPFSPLGKGFFTSGGKILEKMADNDFRRSVPKFQPENLEHNNKLFERVTEVANRKGCTTAQLALAWVHHQGNDVCPIPGTTKIENLESNIKALSVKLTPEEMAELESIAAADAFKGDRYSGAFGALTWRTANTPPLSSWKAAN